MVNFTAPGVYTIESDQSDYAPSLNPTTIGLVGFASKGPANTATLITSPAQFIRTFGTPDVVVGGQGILGGLEVLGSTRQLYYVRAEATGAAGAANYLPIGTCPHAKVTFANLDTINAYKFTFTVSGANTEKTTAGANSVIAYRERPGVDGAPTLAEFAWKDEIARAVADGFDSNTGEVNFSALSTTEGYFVGAYAGSGSRMDVTMASAVVSYTAALSGTPVDTDTLTFADQHDTSGLIGTLFDNADVTPTSGSVSSYGCVFGVSGPGAYTLKSLYNGQGYNYSSIVTSQGTRIRGIQAVATNQNGPGTDLSIYSDGVLEETFPLKWYKPALGSQWPEDLINLGTTNLKSDFIKGRFYSINTDNDNHGGTYVSDTSAVPWTAPTTWGGTVTNMLFARNSLGNDNTALSEVYRFAKFVDGSYNLAGGDNGDADSNSNGGDITSAHTTGAIIGTAAARSGMYALDREDISINLVAVPGITAQSVQNALVTLAESTQNFLALVAPPYGFSTAQQAINWSNGVATARTASLNSSYAAIYWPWVKVFDNYTAADVWYDPTIFALKQMAYTDSVADPWFAPAGIIRGRLTKPTEVEVKLNVGDREALYSTGNVVNPIVKFTTDGIAIYGQRTTQRASTALDRINVRRLMIYLRKLVLTSTRQIVFEPNDPITWQRIREILNPALEDIKIRRGITAYKVVCDNSTNTALRIDRNELWCRVTIKPTKTAEVLVFDLNLTSQGASV